MIDIETVLPPAELSDWDGSVWFWRFGPFAISRCDDPASIGASCCPDTPHLPYFVTSEADGKTHAMGRYATQGEAIEACRADVRREHA